MRQHPVRSRSSLAVLSLLAAGLLCGTVLGAPAQAAGPPSPPSPAPGTLREGPWPPAKVLAADPAQVAAPLAASVATGCQAAPGVHTAAPGQGKTVALTFDDGPGITTGQILAVLDRYGVPATFFNVGINDTVRPQYVVAQAQRGHLLANHAWSHSSLPTLTAAGQAAELDQTVTEEQLLVGSAACTFRPPYGEYDATTLQLAQDRGLTVWTWSVDTEDWLATSASAAEVARIVSLGTSIGSQQHPVVLMHNPPAGNAATVAALPAIIAYYHSHGFTFVDLLGRSLPPNPNGDFGVDGWSDVLARQSTSGALWQYPRTGSAFAAPKQLDPSWSGYDSATTLGDVNRDGWNDVIARDTRTGALVLFKGSLTGLSDPVQIGSGWSGMREITAVGDLTGDGYPDVVAAQISTGDLYLYPGTGSALRNGVRIGTRWDTVDQLTGVGDFDRDGSVDLVARERASGDLYLYRGSAGRFGNRIRIGNNWNGMRDIAGLGDYNRDSYPDLLAVNRINGALLLFAGHGSWVSNGVQVGSHWERMSLVR